MEKEGYSIKKRIEEGRKYKFKGTKYAADMVVITEDEKILLIQRGFYPFGYALPGGKVDALENSEGAAWRELKEETGLSKDGLNTNDVKFLKYVGRFDKENRDPRGRMVSDAYLIYLKKKSNELPIEGKDDAIQAEWVPKVIVKYLIKKNKNLTQDKKDEWLIKEKLGLEDILAFDHCNILEKALEIYKKIKKL